MKLPIYMDYNATTPTDKRVFDAMAPYFTECFGNAASRTHKFGWDAEEAVDTARAQVASLINAHPKEIIFTSGATESDNLAIKGVAEMYADRGDHIITLVTEHKAVLDSCKALEKAGKRVTYLDVDETGLVSLDALAEAITDKTILVSIMHANNEIGVVQPIKEIGALCREKGVLFHTDAVQSVGKIPFDVEEMNVDIAALSAHKMYGPKGVGAIFVRRRKPRVRLTPLIDGGGHERGMRSGTLNVPGIVGFGAAAALCEQEMAEESARLHGLKMRLLTKIEEQLPEVSVNGHREHTLPGTVNISFAYVEGESLLMGMNGIAVSSGSACTSASLEPSYVLKALGVGDELAHSSIRFGLGRFSTEEEVDYVVSVVVNVVNRLRDLSPLWEMAQEGIDLSTVQWAAH